MPIRPLPPELTRYVERSAETPADRFEAWLSAQPPLPVPIRHRPRHRAPQGRLRVWCSISLTLGMLLAVCGGLMLNVVR